VASFGLVHLNANANLAVQSYCFQWESVEQSDLNPAEWFEG
jgi:hypothetical protein